MKLLIVGQGKPGCVKGPTGPMVPAGGGKGGFVKPAGPPRASGEEGATRASHEKKKL